MTDADWQAKFDALQKEHAAHLEGVGKARADEIAALTAAHAEALKAQAEKLAADHAAAMQRAQDVQNQALASQAEQLAARHAAHIADLKEKHLLPAVRDLHARKLADLKAQEQAHLDELMKG